MVKELKEVLSKVERLDDEEQKQIARLLQEEMLWEAALENSRHQLSKLANEALREFKSGKTTQSDW